MRIPFPERVPLSRVAAFCAVLFVAQKMEGTTTFFSLCTMLFILIGALAFNTAGGLTKPSGGFIFSYMVLVALIGFVYKAILGEPAQSNLFVPNRTIEVYVGTVVAMLIAAYLARKFTLKKPLFSMFKSEEQLRLASIGCMYVGVGLALFGTFADVRGGNGSALSLLNQFNAFLPLAMILGVTYEVRKSGGTRSVNVPVLVAGLTIFASGVLAYSKQGMFTPLVCWLFPAAAQRYRMSIAHILGLIVAVGLMVYYLVPYSQVGRNFRVEGQPFSQSVKTNALLLSRLGDIRKLMLLDEQMRRSEGMTSYNYYNRSQGLADRLQMISPDDALIRVTDEGAVFGVFPTFFAFENVIPHFIWHNKPSYLFGNIYAHEAGILDDEYNTDTGISFSPSSDAYHQAKWIGVLVMLPLLLLMLFLVTDSCCGGTRESPFALLAVIAFTHSAPEFGATGIVAAATTGIIVLFVTAFVSTKVMPIIASFFVSPRETRLLRPPISIANAQVSPGEVVSSYRWSRPNSAK